MERVILEQSLLKRYFIKLISGLVSGFVGFALTVIAPNALGSATFGQFSYIQQFFNQVVTFLDGGVSTAFFTKLSAPTTEFLPKVTPGKIITFAPIHEPFFTKIGLESS